MDLRETTGMLNTGQISFISESGGGFDANGDPIAVTETNSAYLPCNLAVLSRGYKTLVDGQYLDSQYSAIIDNYLIEGLSLGSVTKAQLIDSNTVNLGIFQIQNKENLVFTDRLKIVV